MKTTVSTKGQVIIPAEIRYQLHLGPGSELEVTQSGNHIVMVPVVKDPVLASRGIIKGGKSALEIKMEVREEEERYMEKKIRRLFRNKP